MTDDEVQAIARQVKADRKRVLAPLSDALPLRFTNGRLVGDLEGWSDTDLRQLVAVGVDGVGMALAPEVLLEEGPDEGFYAPEVWDVLDAQGALAYRVWIYGTDNGTVCRSDTVEIVAGMSQGGLELARKKGEGTTDALLDALTEAAARVPEGEVFEGSCLRFFGD
jgi:hypothetical protein